jgi:ATP-dependent DNA ligase
MLAQAQDEIPAGEGWLYEPKWDGFRAIVFREGDKVHLCSRNGQPLERYFPEVIAGLKRALPNEIIVDGEIILPGPKGLDFEALSQRIHPAASRVKRLSEETPAGFVAFDLLALGSEDLRPLSTKVRREKLIANFQTHDGFFVTPQTMDPKVARDWFHQFEGAGCDGVIARRLDLDYRPGERVMVKIKHGRTADVVVVGYRDGKTAGSVGSLLLGVYGDDGQLMHIGHTSSFSAKEKKELKVKLKPYEEGAPQFPGIAEAAPNRWSKGQEKAPPTPVRPELVIEVRYDYLQGYRFRHASTFQRWRTDKAPKDCKFSQLLPPNPFSLAKIVALSPGKAPAGDAVGRENGVAPT